MEVSEALETNVINTTNDASKKTKQEPKSNPILEALMRPQLCQFTPQQVFPDLSILQLLDNSYKLEKGLVVKYNRLGVKSAKFKKIKSMFPPSLSVLHVQEVINPFLRLAFELTQNIVYSGVKPLMLFHGTKLDYVHNICTNNFNWRFAGLGRGYKYGKGVYFTESPKFALNFCDTTFKKIVILTDVLVRNTGPGHKGMELPPQDCDTASGKHNTYVKFMDAEFYPHFVVFFCESKYLKM